MVGSNGNQHRRTTTSVSTRRDDRWAKRPRNPDHRSEQHDRSTRPADRNVISGNREGIRALQWNVRRLRQHHPGQLHRRRRGRRDGLPNDNSIVAENAAADGIVIGGNAPGAGNVFHSLYASIQLIGDFGPLANLTVASNRFGLNAGGAALPDADAAAVLVRNASQIDITGNVITHATDGIALEGVTDATISGNTVTDNANAGIRIIGSNLAGNTISQNAIDRNGELGIDLGNRGVTSNDSFPDQLPQNAPVISSVEIAGGSATVQYSVPGADENDSFEVEFFGSPAADASGHGEGLTYLGSETTDGSTTSAVLAVGANDIVTATATRADGSTSGVLTRRQPGGGRDRARGRRDALEGFHRPELRLRTYRRCLRRIHAELLVDLPTRERDVHGDALQSRRDPRRRDDHERAPLDVHEDRVRPER